MKKQFIATFFSVTLVMLNAYAQDPFAAGVANDALRTERDKVAQVEIPVKFRDTKGISLELEKRVERVATYRVVNNSDAPATFACYGINNPLSKIEVLTQGKWLEPSGRMICGTGLYLTGLAAKKSVTFDVEVPDVDSHVRVGIDFFGNEDATGNRPANTIWAALLKPRG
jgi:hypothetical protein